jgi:Tfp pilus assembly protein PilO
MRNRAIALGVLGTLVILLIWNVVVFSPKGRSLSHAKKDTEAAQQVGAGLRAQLAQLEEISQNGPAIAAELDKLNTAVPASADLDGFILSANQIAVTSGIDWLSVAPAVAQAGPEGLSVIPMSIQIKGGFFQVLDYLNRLESMGRLVIVDGINISGSTGATSGAPILSVTLTARMFTRAAPAPPAGSTAPSSGSTSGTTGSTPPASGSSSGETSTTAQVN